MALRQQLAVFAVGVDRIINPKVPDFCIHIENRLRGWVRVLNPIVRQRVVFRLNTIARLIALGARRILPDRFVQGKYWDIPVTDCERAYLSDQYVAHNARLRELLDRPLPW